jgi:hypothetical protein
MIIKEYGQKLGLPKKTESICPDCKKKIEAEIFEKDGKVMIKKTCPEHGYYEDIYWSDVELYRKAEKFAWDGIGLENPQNDGVTCPEDCGLCRLHLSHTALGIVDLTNRCNLNCPICFANANTSGRVYEPSYEQIVDMMKLLRENKPVPCPAIQFSGGEPTLHPDFLKIVREAKNLGFSQIQVATNGLLLPKLAQGMVDSGMHVIYLQFDGINEENYIRARGKPLFSQKMKAIEACRNCNPNLQIVLVPTVVNGVNDGELGSILNFAIENRDVVRGVNYQPVSFCGRISTQERISQRFTTSDLALKLAEQTDFLEKDDFYPVPAVAPLSELISVMKNQPQLAFTVHPHCGISTYLFHGEDGAIVPITRFVDIEGLMETAKTLSEEIKPGSKKALLKSLKLLKFIDKKKAPKGINVTKLVSGFLSKGNKKSIGDIHYKSTFIGCMHFQDEYNYDFERVKRCAIHYPTPDGRIIPFCAYNAGPAYRDQVERKFSQEYKKQKTEAIEHSIQA